MSAGFVHLHVHSEYSVLDGQSRVHDLVERAKQFNMSACALTDHGALFGAIDFYQAAKKAGIKPIIGCELYVATTNRFDKSGRSSGQASYHQLALCENEAGYHNLCRLSSLGYLEGYHYRPRVDLELLARHKEGLIVTSSCLAGKIPRALMKDDVDTADQTIREYIEIFGKDHFLIEVMDHDMPEDKKVNPLLAELAERHGLMMIATNDVHYTEPEDAEAHDALLAVQTGAMIDDANRFRFPKKNFYFAGPDEMREKFADWPEAVSNTELVAERCNVEIPLGKHLIPQFHPPDGYTKLEYLTQLVHDGLTVRYGDPAPEGYRERADFEIGVIDQMGFVDYFLVVWDLINFARQNGIPVGPGRGSGAGSIVAYTLQITNIDPMRYGLLFERFLNPERVSMPDFDIDFCYQRREEMIEYVRNKYGAENVSQIITFGRMLAKQVVRNVGRVLGMPYADVDRIAKLVPDELKIKLKDAYDREPELRELVENDEQVARLWKLATRLEGTIGNCGTHAAGVVICDQPLTDHVALFKASGSDTVATQAEMKNVEAIGLLKMDFLGLRTLTVVHEAVRLIREGRGIEIDIDNIEPDDKKTYALLRSGLTMGVFQLESSGMRDLAKRIGLESLEEICALVALYRPGPMQFIDTYVDNKFHPAKVTYEHPALESILRETYAVPLYQEQIMQMVQALAGFTLGQADIMRRAMGKKKAELMAEQRSRFVEGCAANNINEKLANELFDKIEKFAGYGFNKSHSMAYAFVAYQTAFLKANYPAEFMAALLTSESGNLDKVALYIAECRRMNIEVLPPDINESDRTFTVSGGNIRFGLAAIKNVGEAPSQAVVDERKANGTYADLFDFCSRLDTRQINRRLIESLNKAGAFTGTGWQRSQIEAALDAALSEGQISQRERAAGQTSLFDLMSGAAEESAPVLHQKPEVPEWTEQEILAYEKEMLGLYVSSHPLAKHALTLERFANLRLDEWAQLKDGQEIIAGGLINTVKKYTTKTGKKMAFLTLDTLEGSVEITVFADVCEKCADLLIADTIVIIPARVSYRNDEPGLLANDVHTIEEAEKLFTRAVHVRLASGSGDEAHLEQLAGVMGDHIGACDVYLHYDTPSDEVTVHASSACRVKPSEDFRRQVEDLVGTGNIWYAGANGLPRHR